MEDLKTTQEDGFVNFLKLCICFAASEGKKEIGERTMIMANTLLYAKPKRRCRKHLGVWEEQA